ncbi:uncharacterized protein LOC122814264 [Protopterus annectens]|uniref:uncharacterized protein LOC122814264 n=1 Tax=Protopterus annectens TaxID=7888 RepID=UPI001CF9B3F7|nr:uncharacterized protein LOC122814264 [Protopterus annectens]
MGNRPSLNIQVFDRDESGAPIASFDIYQDSTVQDLKYKLRLCCPIPLSEEEMSFECKDCPQVVNNSSKILPDLMIEPIEWTFITTCYVRRMCQVDNGDKQFLIYVWWKKCAKRLYVTESHTVRSVKNYIQKEFHGMDVLGKEFVLYRFADGQVLDDTETLLKSGIGPGFILGIESLTWQRKTPGLPPSEPYPVTVTINSDKPELRVIKLTVYVRPSERLHDVKLKLRMDHEKNDSLGLLVMFDWEVCIPGRQRGSYNRDSTLELLNVGIHSQLELVGEFDFHPPLRSGWKFILDFEPPPLVPNVTESGDTLPDLKNLSVIDGMFLSCFSK